MKILMVCLGNICRSPLAQGILEDKIKKRQLDWEVDSAGTSSWHVGERPDPRSIQIAKENGIDISNQRGRQYIKEDYESFDMILAMDSANYNDIHRISGVESSSKVKLVLNYAYPGQNRSVPDPYYDDGFEGVFAMLDLALDQLVEENK